MRWRLLAFAACLALSGCATFSSDDVEPAQAAVTAPEADLLAVDRAFAAMAAREGVAVAFVHFAADDAHQFSPGADPVVGRTAVSRFWMDFPANGTISWAPEYAEVSASGDLGWTWGRGVTTVNGRSVGSRYVTVWKRDAVGAWRWVADIGVADPPR